MIATENKPTTEHYYNKDLPSSKVALDSHFCVWNNRRDVLDVDIMRAVKLHHHEALQGQDQRCSLRSPFTYHVGSGLHNLKSLL